MDIFLCTALIWILLKFHQTKAELLHSASGDVGHGNFTYYSLMYTGFISLKLTSNSGDCDLYVSQHLPQPTFEDDSYCLQSATCGVDTIIIPKSFRRPVGIGIYGHPSHDISSYALHVYRINEFSDEFTDELSLTIPDGEERAAHLEARSSTKEYDAVEESFFSVLLWNIMEFLVEILFTL